MKPRTSPLTPDEAERLRIVRADWLAVGLSTEPADRPEAEAAVKELYAVMGWREPLTIWMDSPLGGIAAAAWFESIGKESKRGQLRDQLGGQLGGQLWDQLWGQLGGQLGGQLRGQLGDQLRGQLWGQLRGQLRDQLSNTWWGQHDAYLMAWWSFARELGVEYDPQHDKALDAWCRICRSCGWWWPREGVVILTERHSQLRRHPDGSGRLHSEDGLPAVAYPDGYELYAWRGLRLPKEAFDREWLTTDRITGEQNAERRRAYMEIYGQHRYMREAGGELLDEVHEPPFPGLIDARLWKLPNPDGPEPLVCVECRNSTPEPDGTYKTYALWVDPQCETAHEALAWTFDVDVADYAPVVES